MKKHSARMASALSLLVIGFGSQTALADDAAATGVAAGLGLTAAGGKTTIASGGGVSEVALLTSESFGEAGALIATLVRSKVAKRPIFVLTHDEQFDLSGPRYVKGRIESLQGLLDSDGCVPTAAPPAGVRDIGGAAAPKVSFTDIGAALQTDTSISSVPLTVDDRILVTAIAMSQRVAGQYAPITWKSAETEALPSATLSDPAPAPYGTSAMFLVPSDILAVPSNSVVMQEFQTLLNTADKQRSCAKNAKVSGVLTDVDSFAKTVITAPDKGGPSPLGAAAELEAATSGESDLLRVAIEQAGGTSIARSNIWYALGLPNSAIVSASLIASFRLTDGNSGQVLMAGFIRCAVAPVNIKNVAGTLSSARRARGTKKASVSCSYLA